MSEHSEFSQVFGNPEWSDKFYMFLQTIFHLYPEDRFHHLIAEHAALGSDEKTYQQVQAGLKQIKPFLSELTYALPALKKQKREMTRQLLEVLNGKKTLHGYLEIGSTGRYISDLKKHADVSGPVYLMNDIAPSNSIADIMERGGLRKAGTFLPLNYAPVPATVSDNSVELATCMIGLHHCPEELLPAFIASVHRVVKPGGCFVIRDHDVQTPEMATFVSLVHTVFNLGLNETWEKNQQEYRSFRPIEEWVAIATKAGFEDMGFRVLQDRDPSLNTLIAFRKIS